MEECPCCLTAEDAEDILTELGYRPQSIMENPHENSEGWELVWWEQEREWRMIVYPSWKEIWKLQSSSSGSVMNVIASTDYAKQASPGLGQMMRH